MLVWKSARSQLEQRLRLIDGVVNLGFGKTTVFTLRIFVPTIPTMQAEMINGRSLTVMRRNDNTRSVGLQTETDLETHQGKGKDGDGGVALSATDPFAARPPALPAEGAVKDDTIFEADKSESDEERQVGTDKEVTDGQELEANDEDDEDEDEDEEEMESSVLVPKTVSYLLKVQSYQ